MLFTDTTPKLAGHQVQLYLIQKFLHSVIRAWRQDREEHGILGWERWGLNPGSGSSNCDVFFDLGKIPTIGASRAGVSAGCKLHNQS